MERFAQAGLPTPELFLLDTEEEIAALAANAPSELLMQDLELLTTGDMVVRTDVDSSMNQGHLFLPKSENIATPGPLARFLVEVTQQLLESGLRASEICFISHRYLRARACAWAYAQPGDPLVQIDSTWGLVDGLNWCAHDSSLVNVESGHVRRQVAPKPLFFDVLADQRWEFRDTPTEWIWRSSASEGQLITMAAAARRLADLKSEPLATMWFVSLLDNAEVDCLPWFSVTYDIDVRSTERASAGGRRELIVTPDDLRRVEEANPPASTILRLQPIGDFVRSTEFIDKISGLASRRRYLIEIEGSPLAHPYYLFRRRGIPVTCVRPRRPIASVTKHEKLVRDNIPNIIEQRGELAVTYRATGNERPALLRAKLVEEALELYRAVDSDEAIQELADVTEVAKALQRLLGISDEELDDAVDGKRMRRGGFDESLVLVQTSPFELHANSTDDQAPLPGFETMRPRVRSRLVREEGRRLLLSYIPPLPVEQQTFRARIGGHEVVVVYRKADIVVEPVDANFSDKEQLLLPGF